jgi:hypothetical protein
MALVQKNIDIKKFDEGATVKGYLLGASVIEMPPYNAGGPPGHVPKLIMQDEKGAKFSVLLGSAMAGDVPFWTLNVWTEVTKGKKAKGKKNDFFPYTVMQDDAKSL